MSKVHSKNKEKNVSVETTSSFWTWLIFMLQLMKVQKYIYIFDVLDNINRRLDILISTTIKVYLVKIKLHFTNIYDHICCQFR